MQPAPYASLSPLASRLRLLAGSAAGAALLVTVLLLAHLAALLTALLATLLPLCLLALPPSVIRLLISLASRFPFLPGLLLQLSLLLSLLELLGLLLQLLGLLLHPLNFLKLLLELLLCLLCLALLLAGLEVFLERLGPGLVVILGWRVSLGLLLPVLSHSGDLLLRPQDVVDLVTLTLGTGCFVLQELGVAVLVEVILVQVLRRLVLLAVVDPQSLVQELVAVHVVDCQDGALLVLVADEREAL
mmetsp:Transcript_74309/g.168322  ORF Transcript_74309/g.168322 Transcript_74309/m.168322 type:complete len:245 (-) Transcript_74309:310-1044(-)